MSFTIMQKETKKKTIIKRFNDEIMITTIIDRTTGLTKTNEKFMDKTKTGQRRCLELQDYFVATKEINHGTIRS